MFCRSVNPPYRNVEEKQVGEHCPQQEEALLSKIGNEDTDDSRHYVLNVW